MGINHTKTMRYDMYHDRGLFGVILGFFFTMAGSIWMAITTTDISFTITVIAGIATTTAALIKGRRDWKEGRMKPFWYNWKRKGKRRA